ncbi:MAG: DUF664 domain-containing protein [Nocardioidaceae bacterium]|nr:DUF664 domain-containing protein [Nocardioidaceae bacterium]
MRFPEPAADTSDPALLSARYLDFYRGTVLEKLAALNDEDLRTSRLPSGWTPIELLGHLAHMEQRWFVWGFLGEEVVAPWGDRAGDGGSPDGRWHVPEDVEVEALARMLHEVGGRTTDILRGTPLDTVGATGGRFEEDPPTLAWICFHVLQEYARHAGHLDVAVELAGGPTGE